MEQNEDSTKGAGDIELQQQKPSVDRDKTPAPNTADATSATDVSKSASAATDDTPPDPPKRDYATEKAETKAEDNSPEYASVNKRKKLGSFPPRPEFVYKPESPEAWMSCLRISLIVFNLFIWLLGAVITALGIWIKVDKEFWNIQANLDVTQFTSASYVLIVIGIIIMVVGFIGCYGAVVSQVCMLIVFAVIISILILMEIAVMALVWTATTNKNTQEKMKLKAITALHEMMDNDQKRYFINLIQAKLECCGVNGPQDYNLESNPKPLPNSCTNEVTRLPYQKGCYDALTEYLHNKAATVGGIAVAVFILQLGALVFTTCLICGIKQSSTSGIF